MKALLIIFLTGIFSLFAGLFSKQRSLVLLITIIGILAAIVGIVVDWSQPAFVFENMLNFDHFSFAFSGVTLISTLMIIALSQHNFKNLTDTLGDHYGLILFSLCGVFCMTAFENLMMLFLGIEILSIPLYILAGSKKHNLASNEAALKYFLMGAFATGILLFGMTFIYGSTGSFTLDGIATYISAAGGNYSPLFLIGILLIMVGLSFKVSAAPFHFWSPDVYQGSPNLITAYMSTVVKTAGFAAFFRLFIYAFAEAESTWVTSLAIISAITMILGNVTALYQSNFKRLMAYSSIAHAGYLILGLIGLKNISSGAILLYTFAYSIATICIFGVFMLINESKNNQEINVFNGLGRTNPFLAFVTTVAILSLAGIPPTAGFLGKYFLFTQSFESHPWLIVVAILSSAISIAYYFKIIIAMYFTDKEISSHQMAVNVPLLYQIVLLAGVTLLFALCIAPESILSLATMN